MGATHGSYARLDLLDRADESVGLLTATGVATRQKAQTSEKPDKKGTRQSRPAITIAALPPQAAATWEPASNTLPSKLPANFSASPTCLNWRRKRLSRPGRKAISNRAACIPGHRARCAFSPCGTQLSALRRRTSRTYISHPGNHVLPAALHGAGANRCNELFCRKLRNSMRNQRSPHPSSRAGYRYRDDDIARDPK